MRNFLFACTFSVISAFGLFSCGLHEFLPDIPITEEKMVDALQQALFLGSQTAASNLGDQSCSKMKDCATGYLGNKLVEIAVPDTVNNVLKKINSFSNNYKSTYSLLANIVSLPDFGKYADSIKTALNRGAEQAAPASIEVFKSAIFGMSFSDARGVLKGDSIAATSYLHNTTYAALTTAFSPIIKEPLELLNPNKYWSPIASGYNTFVSSLTSAVNNYNTLNPVSKISMSDLKLPYASLPTDISTSLSEYATGKALDGLFLMVGKQESQLRADPWGTVKSVGNVISDTVGDLLGNVFSDAKDGVL